MKSSGRLIPFIIFAALYACICMLIFHFIDEPTKSTDINLVNRGIDSTIRLWLNGYFGLFFGFRFLGTLNWLVLPLIVWFIFSAKKSERWQYVLLVFYFIALILIVSQGYFNSRYQITLLPLTITMVLYLFWNFSEAREWKAEKYFLLALFFGFTLYNDGKYFLYHGPKDDQNTTAGGDHKSGVKSQTTANTRNYSRWLNPLPSKMIGFIKDLPVSETAKVLVNNVPFYFYYTGKPGVYCWSQDDVYYDAEGAKPMMRNQNGSNFSDFLVNKLHCRYIVTASAYAGYSKGFDEYVAAYCTMIFNDSNGYVLYEIKADSHSL